MRRHGRERERDEGTTGGLGRRRRRSDGEDEAGVYREAGELVFNVIYFIYTYISIYITR
jgi:hypothetical protein